MNELTACAYPALPPPLDLQLVTLPDRACPYLPDRTATHRGLWASRVDGSIYHRFMDRSFRRGGRLLYQPVCRGCRACVPVRVPTREFQPSKSQRRCQRRNGDLIIQTSHPVATDEKFDLYQRYQTQWHASDEDREPAAAREAFESFLYESNVDTLEMTYRHAATGRLLAVGIADVCEQSFSSVYYYFDPAEASRGLGTFGALREIAFAAAHGIAHYYLGYWVAGCAKMAYKTRFQPVEMLDPDGVWRSPREVGQSQ